MNTAWPEENSSKTLSPMDDEAFAEKMKRLTTQLAEQMEKGQELDALIRECLGRLGYSV